jgi:hypothetical protein
MIKSQKNPPKPLLRATAPRQVSIAFESIGLWGPEDSRAHESGDAPGLSADAGSRRGRRGARR